MVNKNKNPIKEIVLSISFDSTLDVTKLEEFCRTEEIQKDFSHVAPGYDATLIVDDKPKSEFKHTGYILRSDGEKKEILNLKLGKLSYHILDRYEDFQYILDHLDYYWGVFQRIFGEINVSLVSLRYINLIKITSDEGVEDYIQVEVKAPFKNVYSQFVNFTIHPKVGDSNIKANVTIANNQDSNIILDTVLERKVSKKVVKNISDLFFELRPIKNNIFEQLITEKTKQRFEI